MSGYMIIYVKNDVIGHVRYEIGDGRGYKQIRGLSVKWEKDSSIPSANTIYEKGEEDSHGINVYDQDYYLPSDKIPLNREELVGALAYTQKNDEEHEDYGVLSQNCNDFTAGVLAAAGKEGCVGDYLTAEQKSGLKASRSSDFVKCRIPRSIDETIENVKDKVSKLNKQIKKTVCNGIVHVKSYMREGHHVEAYTRSCGRH